MVIIYATYIIVSMLCNMSAEGFPFRIFSETTQRVTNDPIQPQNRAVAVRGRGRSIDSKTMMREATPCGDYYIVEDKCISERFMFFMLKQRPSWSIPYYERLVVWRFPKSLYDEVLSTTTDLGRRLSAIEGGVSRNDMIAAAKPLGDYYILDHGCLPATFMFYVFVNLEKRYSTEEFYTKFRVRRFPKQLYDEVVGILEKGGEYNETSPPLFSAVRDDA